MAQHIASAAREAANDGQTALRGLQIDHPKPLLPITNPAGWHDEQVGTFIKRRFAPSGDRACKNHPVMKAAVRRKGLKTRQVISRTRNDVANIGMPLHKVIEGQNRMIDTFQRLKAREG